MSRSNRWKLAILAAIMLDVLDDVCVEGNVHARDGVRFVKRCEASLSASNFSEHGLKSSGLGLLAVALPNGPYGVRANMALARSRLRRPKRPCPTVAAFTQGI